MSSIWPRIICSWECEDLERGAVGLRQTKRRTWMLRAKRGMILVVMVVLFGFVLLGCETGGSGSTDSGDTTGDSDEDSNNKADCTDGPLSEPIAGCSLGPVLDSGNFKADCVARINQFRWDCQCLPPLDRWTDGETCADKHAEYDSTNGAHAGFIDDICAPRGSAPERVSRMGIRSRHRG